ncbi:MAG: type II toxin-antitoxin system VapC family toxin [Desulfobacterales bacterium]
MGWRKHTEESFATAKKMLAKAKIYSLNTSIVEQTVRIRRQYRIKLPDAVIAASCLVHDLTLVTVNDKDFEGIDGLNMYNPLNVILVLPQCH